jgi:hypothetical protein
MRLQPTGLLHDATWHRAATAFLGRLEDQVQRAFKPCIKRNGFGRREQHGGVAIVAAGVHEAGLAAGPLHA